MPLAGTLGKEHHQQAGFHQHRDLDKRTEQRRCEKLVRRPKIDFDMKLNIPDPVGCTARRETEGTS